MTKEEVEMNRSYNHITHINDSIGVLKSSQQWHRSRGLTWYIRHGVKHGANQLDDEQRHTGFDYYECDMSKFGTPS